MEPKFKVPDRPSKLDPFAETLSGWLRIDAGKSRKLKRTARQMHADLVALGHDGSYDRVAAFVRAWKAERQREQQTSGRGTFVPLVFAPGEACQFDWSEDWAMIAGKPTKLQAAHTKLAHSKAFIVRAYPLQTHEMLFDALSGRASDTRSTRPRREGVSTSRRSDCREPRHRICRGFCAAPWA